MWSWVAGNQRFVSIAMGPMTEMETQPTPFHPTRLH